MANTTDPTAHSVHGTDPQNLVETILRHRIYESQYWKERCFGLTADLLIDRAVKLEYVGGTYSANSKPTPFMCLVLKLLQIQPDKDIILEYINNEDYKYLRALGAFYLRLVGKPVDIYTYLEPLYTDYRKLAQRSPGGWQLTHMDEFIDELLTGDACCDITLPRLPKRSILESSGALGPRVSALDGEIESEMVSPATAPEGGRGSRPGPGAHSRDEPRGGDDRLSAGAPSRAAREAPGKERNEEGGADRRDAAVSRPTDHSRTPPHEVSHTTTREGEERRGGGGSQSYNDSRRDGRDGRDRSRSGEYENDRGRRYRSSSRDRRPADRYDRDRRTGDADRHRERSRERRRSRSRSPTPRRHSSRYGDRWQERRGGSRPRSPTHRHSSRHSDDSLRGDEYRVSRYGSRGRSRSRSGERYGAGGDGSRARDTHTRSSAPAASAAADIGARSAPAGASVLPVDEDAGVRRRATDQQVASFAAKMFKNKGGAAGAEAAPPAASTAAEGSVEYWNEMRTKLGMKPLAK